jgi:hypothetical protein
MALSVKARSAQTAWSVVGTVLFATSWCGVSGADAGGAPTVWVPDGQVIARLERRITLPVGAYKLAQYTRYYTGVIRDGHRIVRGTYVAGVGKVIIVETERDMLPPMDGGCEVVNIDYDVDARKAIQVYCNGVA